MLGLLLQKSVGTMFQVLCVSDLDLTDPLACGYIKLGLVTDDPLMCQNYISYHVCTFCKLVLSHNNMIFKQGVCGGASSQEDIFLMCSF